MRNQITSVIVLSAEAEQAELTGHGVTDAPDADGKKVVLEPAACRQSCEVLHYNNSTSVEVRGCDEKKGQEFQNEYVHRTHHARSYLRGAEVGLPDVNRGELQLAGLTQLRKRTAQGDPMIPHGVSQKGHEMGLGGEVGHRGNRKG
jgi:hypothetical protein